jgi:hypothetical protein
LSFFTEPVFVNDYGAQESIPGLLKTIRSTNTVSVLSFLSRARICRPFKELRNLFPAWRNRFLGIYSWSPYTFTNTGPGFYSNV